VGIWSNVNRCTTYLRKLEKTSGKLESVEAWGSRTQITRERIKHEATLKTGKNEISTEHAKKEEEEK